MDVGALEGDLDDYLAIRLEVNTNPLNGLDHVPCAHLHFDQDNLAFSVFKSGRDVLLLRPESGVALLPQVMGDGSIAYLVK